MKYETRAREKHEQVAQCTATQAVMAVLNFYEEHMSCYHTGVAAVGIWDSVRAERLWQNYL
jgi:hypothetical protein